MGYDVTNNTSTIELVPGRRVPVPADLTPITLPPVTPTPELVGVDAPAQVGAVVEIPDNLPTQELIAVDNISPVGDVVELPPSVPPDGIVYLETIPISEELNLVVSPTRFENLEDVDIVGRMDGWMVVYQAATNTYIHIEMPEVDEPTFDSDTTVVLSGGKSFGKYTNGQVVPMAGKTAREVILDALVEYISATWSSFSVTGQPTTLEVGSSISGARTFTWSINPNSGAVPSIDIMDETISSPIVLGTPNDGTHTAPINPIQLDSEGATQRWRGVATDITPDPDVVFYSNYYTVTGRFYRFYGYSVASVVDSATVRGLPQSSFQATASFNLNTGSTLTKFVVALPPGKIISQVIDLDALNTDITSEYIAQPSINVLDAGGTNRAYSIYEMNIGVPYSFSHRHQIITA